MIVNLIGIVTNEGKIILADLPPVYFIGPHSVCVTEMAIKWRKKVSNMHGTLNSTLIDRSPVNPKQQLLFFYQNKGSDFTYVSPTHTSVYKIQCPSLQSSEFTLELSERHQIEKIWIQIKIADERVQQINKKSL